MVSVWEHRNGLGAWTHVMMMYVSVSLPALLSCFMYYKNNGQNGDIFIYILEPRDNKIIKTTHNAAGPCASHADTGCGKTSATLVSGAGGAAAAVQDTGCADGTSAGMQPPTTTRVTALPLALELRPLRSVERVSCRPQRHHQHLSKHEFEK